MNVESRVCDYAEIKSDMDKNLFGGKIAKITGI